MRWAVALTALLLVPVGCAADEDRGPHRFVVQQVVALPDLSVAAAGMASAGSDEDGGCRVGGKEVRDFFVTRIGRSGEIVRTDLVEEEEFDKCGGRLLGARLGEGTTVEASGWWHKEGLHGPIDLSFAEDGSTEYDLESAAGRLREVGGTELARVTLPDHGTARLWTLGGRSLLWLDIARPGHSPVRAPNPLLPDDVEAQDVWDGGHSLSGDAGGVYVGTTYAERHEFPRHAVFRHRYDGTLDRSFGAGGMLAVPPPGVEPFALTQVVADGRGGLLVVGGTEGETERTALVLRFRRDGTLDRAFGDAGVVRLELPRPTVDLYRFAFVGAAVRPDGRIAVAGGVHESGSRVWVLHPDGRLDLDFAGDGRIELAPS